MSIIEEQAPATPREFADRIDFAAGLETAQRRMAEKPAPVMDEGGFDLGADLAAASEAEIGVVKVHVRDKSGRLRYFVKNGETVPVTVTIHNSFSQLAQKVDAQMRKERVRGRVTYDTLFKRQTHKLVRCTTDWEGIVDERGQPKPFSRREIENYYAKNHFLRKDALEAMEDDEGEDFFET